MIDRSDVRDVSPNIHRMFLKYKIIIIILILVKLSFPKMYQMYINLDLI